MKEEQKLEVFKCNKCGEVILSNEVHICKKGETMVTRLQAIKALNNFINSNAHSSEERTYLHDCLTKLEDDR